MTSLDWYVVICCLLITLVSGGYLYYIDDGFKRLAARIVEFRKSRIHKKSI